MKIFKVSLTVFSNPTPVSRFPYLPLETNNYAFMKIVTGEWRIEMNVIMNNKVSNKRNNYYLFVNFM